MKGKAIARQRFCDVYQEGDGEPLATALADRIYLSIGGSSLPDTASVLSARITRLLGQENRPTSRILLRVSQLHFTLTLLHGHATLRPHTMRELKTQSRPRHYRQVRGMK